MFTGRKKRRKRTLLTVDNLSVLFLHITAKQEEIQLISCHIALSQGMINLNQPSLLHLLLTCPFIEAG